MKVTYGAIVQDASGRFGGTVHSNWKGVGLVRRFRKPTDPNTTGQQDVRNTFRNLTRMYQLLPQATKAAWDSWVVGKPLIARNKLIAMNVGTLANEPTFELLTPVPGDSSTIPPSAFVPVGGVGQITTTITAPTAPSGWTIAGCVACAINNDGQPPDNNPDIADLQIYEGEDDTAPYTPTITGLPANDYYTWAFIVWTAPDGSTRVSAALPAAATVTVT